MTDQRLAGAVVAIDTATRRHAVALRLPDGSVASDVAERGSRPLLDQLDVALRSHGLGPADIAAIVVGTGPGSFTGLRVGMATAKTLAHVLGVPVRGIPTTRAIAAAAAVDDAALRGRPVAVVMAAGARDHYLERIEDPDGEADAAGPDGARLLPAGTDLRSAIGDAVPVAVGVEAAGLDPDAVARGDRALVGLGPALLGLGIRSLEAGRSDDAATLVPAYVALPRGIAAAGEGTWSPDLR
jgi:tRNA threonylcarbamoyl adenosine modification protein YeaZ